MAVGSVEAPEPVDERDCQICHGAGYHLGDDGGEVLCTECDGTGMADGDDSGGQSATVYRLPHNMRAGSRQRNIAAGRRRRQARL